ncbi:conserved hypothetical protein [Oleispira antarctica RB-8]|uniref:DUF3087 domain-containing protein n=1 Tax=Oleispira antarctica RB-8 TaxID=698738 RepID=R4YPJ7_OLEAN|nr:conserved hypothetical protein [Oleispira antarctica RB-8]|tara:strand:+ start:1304 stop:1816 length:513 start_codon:yes stop_codon:yes gene_type:complete
MQLQTIDKALYRKRLNIVLITSIAVLLVISLSVSNILIALFGSGIEGDNFWWNVLGVVAGAAVVVSAFKVMANKPFMAEINYVRSLKREMNRIYRSSKKLNIALEANDKNAIIISYFNLQASKQVYQLDNNTLTMEELSEKIRLLDEKIETLGLSISVYDYQPNLVKQLG